MKKTSVSKIISTLVIFSMLFSALPVRGAIAASPPPPPPVTIHEIQYTEDPSGDSPLEGQTVTTQGVVTANFSAGGVGLFFIQDGTGPWNGLYLYEPNGFLNVGDLVQITGTVQEWFGLTEIAYGDATIIGTAPVPDPTVLPTVDVSQEQWESMLVRVEDVTVTNDDLGFGQWLVDDDSGGVRVSHHGFYNYVPQNGDLLRYIQGPLYYSYGNFKIEPRDDLDLGPVICGASLPMVEVTTSLDTLWPPNHQYVDVTAVADISGDLNSIITLVSVESNEPDDGLGDGDMPDDILIVDDFTFKLRAERAGGGNGRIYTVTYQVTDACGNSTTATATVTMPHNQ